MNICIFCPDPEGCPTGCAKAESPFRGPPIPSPCTEVQRQPRKCKDGGTCHHSCASGDCFRERYCAPLSGSGLDSRWRPLRTCDDGSACTRECGPKLCAREQTLFTWDPWANFKPAKDLS